MMNKTQGICLRNTRYGDSSVVCRIFTSEFGISSYLVQGIHRKTASIRPSHIAPGNIVDMVIYHKPGAGIQRVKELRIQESLSSIHTDMVKNAILQFILEMVVKTNEEHLKDEIIFQYIRSTIVALEAEKEGINRFPLVFLCGYLRFTGWFPNLESYEEGYVFNLNEGQFEDPESSGISRKLDVEISKVLFELLEAILNNQSIVQMTPMVRHQLFTAMLQYYEIHILKGKKIHSPEILNEILS